jgi:hypothetical protein
MDTIADLEAHGGSATQFEIAYGSGASLHMYRFLEPQLSLYSWESDHAWSVFGRVKAIFEPRKHYLKNAIVSLPRSLKFSLWAIAVVFFFTLTQIHGRLGVGLFITYLVLIALFFVEINRPSRVTLSAITTSQGLYRRDNGNWRKRYS